MKALFDDVVYPALNDTPCACVFGFPCKDPSELSALGIQLDEFGLPLVNAMDNVSSGRLISTPCPIANLASALCPLGGNP